MKPGALLVSRAAAVVAKDWQAVAITREGACAPWSVIALDRTPHARCGSAVSAVFRQFTGQMES